MRHGHYQHANLGRALRALYGRSTLADSLSGLVIPVFNIDGRSFQHESASSARTNMLNEGGHALWFKNLRLPDARHPEPVHDVALFDAVMASTAAPTYFPCHQFQMRDGMSGEARDVTAIDGSIFDNACMTYIGGLQRHIPEDREVIMIVLGTGYFNKSIARDEWNRYGSLGVVDPTHDMPLINIFFYASETALYQRFSEEMEDRLFVFNKSLLNGPYKSDYPSVDIDDASPENLRKLQNFFEMMLEENRKNFEKVCDILVKNYDRRIADGKVHTPDVTAKAEGRIRRGLNLLKRPFNSGE
jgi:hypothetical protein